jgi:integrase
MLNELPTPKGATRRKHLGNPKRETPSQNSISKDSLKPRSEKGHTRYSREREPDFGEGVEMGEIYLRQPVFTQPWHQEVGDLLRRRYEIAGWSRTTYMKDFSMLRALCGEMHPSEIRLQHLEEQILKGQTLATRETYVARVKSVWGSLRILGVIPMDNHVDQGLPKIRLPRYSPRPITKEQAIMLMTQANEPMREWFMFACLAGMRAIEVSRVRGDWLELHADGYYLRIFGKGGTELLVPCHPKLVELIQSKNVLGLLYTIDNNYLSRLACAEMRRLGIMTKRNGSTASRISFHSCRHFFATTVLQASGGNLITTQRLMRHASPVMTARYADLVNLEERTVMTGLLSDIEWGEVE